MSSCSFQSWKHFLNWLERVCISGTYVFFLTGIGDALTRNLGNICVGRYVHGEAQKVLCTSFIISSHFH
jgi:hypothetical protein